jgi:antirestriction protein ArdC
LIRFKHFEAWLTTAKVPFVLLKKHLCCADLSLTSETREDPAAYISFWLKALKNDKKAVFVVASHAQNVIDINASQ